MAVAKSGRLSAVEVTERISPSWSSEHCLMWPHNGMLTSFSPEVTQLFNEITDISVIMQVRCMDILFLSPPPSLVSKCHAA